MGVGILTEKKESKENFLKISMLIEGKEKKLKICYRNFPSNVERNGRKIKNFLFFSFPTSKQAYEHVVTGKYLIKFMEKKI